MAVCRYMACIALLIVLGTNRAPGASPEEAVEFFRRGCLEHLPDFSGSENALQELGFVRTRRSVEDFKLVFRRYFNSSEILAALHPQWSDRIEGCAFFLKVPGQNNIDPVMRNLIAELSLLLYHYTTNEQGNTESYFWKIGTRGVLVTVISASEYRSFLAVTSAGNTMRGPDN